MTWWLEQNAEVLLLATDLQTRRAQFIDNVTSLASTVDVQSMTFADFKTFFLSWWTALPRPWQVQSKTFGTWAHDEIKERFCDWWIFIHNSDFWFLDTDNIGFKDRYDWYQFSECATWALSNRRQIRKAVDRQLGTEFTVGDWFKQLIAKLKTIQWRQVDWQAVDWAALQQKARQTELTAEIIISDYLDRDFTFEAEF